MFAERGIVIKEEVKRLLGLNRNGIEITKIETIIENGCEIRLIYLESNKKKYKCPMCQKFTSSVHDKLKPVELKYLKIAEYNSKLIVTKRRFICHNCNKRFTEDLGLNSNKRTISNSLKIKIRKDLLKYNLSISAIAVDNNVSEDRVRNELLDAMSDYPEYLKVLPSVISLDEFKADTSYGKYALIINNPIKKKTLDILPNRKKDYLISYFTRIENRGNVKIVISDMYEPYLLVTKIMFKNAKYVVDRFHYTRYIMDALDNIRIRLQNKYEYNSTEYKLLNNKKNVSLLRKYSAEISWYVYVKRYEKGRIVEKLPIDILHQLLNINDDLDKGYELKELFLDIFHHSDYNNAETEIKCWLDLCNESNIEEFVEASKTIENWLPYIVNSFIDKRYSNGYTEGLNNKIKVIKRIGYGYKNFDFFRLRILYIFNGILRGNTKDKNIKKVENKKK